MSLFAGLDGGASKIRARVVDASGSLIGEGLAGPGSLTISPEFAATNARSALEQALEGSRRSLGECRLVCGLAGHRQQAARSTFEDKFNDVASIEVVSDGYAALLGAHGGAPGAIVIVGTGSIGLSLDAAGTLHQVGGWGPVAGDEGSGNWLGRKAVRMALRAHDQCVSSKARPSPLLEAIYREMGGEHEAILDWLAAADATRFGALVPLILEHDRADDPVARDLLADATNQAGRLVRLASQEGKLDVALLGGLAETLSRRIDPTLTLVSPRDDAVEGALHRARGLAPPEIYAQQVV